MLFVVVPWTKKFEVMVGCGGRKVEVMNDGETTAAKHNASSSETNIHI